MDVNSDFNYSTKTRRILHTKFSTLPNIFTLTTSASIADTLQTNIAMISLMLSLLLLLLAFIIVNSTPPFSRQNAFLIASETKKGCQGKLTILSRFLQARAPQILTPKNMLLICPVPLTMVQPVDHLVNTTYVTLSKKLQRI
jgi:hypothetical protein